MENKNISKKKKIITTVVTVLSILAVLTISPQWNEIWYKFGQNLYYMLH